MNLWLYVIIGIIIGLGMIVVTARSFSKSSNLEPMDLFAAILIGSVCGFLWPVTSVAIVVYLICIPLVKIINRHR